MDIDTNNDYESLDHGVDSDLEVTRLAGSNDPPYDFPIPGISLSHVSNSNGDPYEKNNN